MSTLFYITNAISTQVLDIPLDNVQPGIAPGLIVQQFTKNGGKNQQWYLSRLGENHVAIDGNNFASGFKIMNQMSGLCLSITANTSAANPWVAQFLPVLGDGGLSLWNLCNPVANAPQGFNVINQASGEVLDLPLQGGGESVAQKPGLRIQQYPAKANPALPNQEWTFVPVLEGQPQLSFSGQQLADAVIITIAGTKFKPNTDVQLSYWTTQPGVVPPGDALWRVRTDGNGRFSSGPFGQTFVAQWPSERVSSNWVTIYAEDIYGYLLAVRSASIANWVANSASG